MKLTIKQLRETSVPKDNEQVDESISQLKEVESDEESSIHEDIQEEQEKNVSQQSKGNGKYEGDYSASFDDYSTSLTSSSSSSTCSESSSSNSFDTPTSNQVTCVHLFSKPKTPMHMTRPCKSTKVMTHSSPKQTGTFFSYS